MADLLTRESCQPVWNAPSITVQGCPTDRTQAIVVERPDSISVAAELGRLDFVSALLACIGILLIVVAFPAYRLFKYQTEQAVRQELESWRDRIDDLVSLELEERLPAMVDQYVQLAAHSVDISIGDAVAGAQEDGEQK